MKDPQSSAANSVHRPARSVRWARVRRVLLVGALAVALLALVFQNRLRHIGAGVIGHITQATVADRVAQYGESAHARLTPAFQSAHVLYPPRRVTLIGLKAERRLEIWAAEPLAENAVDLAAGTSTSGAAGTPSSVALPELRWIHIKDYAILAASGPAGPKLRQGDRHVPEGLYRIDSLNPNSFYHLSLHIDYPNAEDLARAREDGREVEGLGGNIMMHGMDVSIGCIALGDEGAEDLFVLAADVGLERIDVILCPCDLRVQPAPVVSAAPAWVGARYARMAEVMNGFRER